MTSKVSYRYSLRLVQQDGDRNVGRGDIKRPASLDHISQLTRGDMREARKELAELRKRGIFTAASCLVELREFIYPVLSTVDQDNLL